MLLSGLVKRNLKSVIQQFIVFLSFYFMILMIYHSFSMLIFISPKFKFTSSNGGRSNNNKKNPETSFIVNCKLLCENQLWII